MKFTNDGGDMMFLSQDTADRQLDRCGLTTATAIGETLVFFRSENAKGGDTVLEHQGRRGGRQATALQASELRGSR
jgi:hypothetical protein